MILIIIVSVVFIIAAYKLGVRVGIVKTQNKKARMFGGKLDLKGRVLAGKLYLKKGDKICKCEDCEKTQFCVNFQKEQGCVKIRVNQI